MDGGELTKTVTLGLLVNSLDSGRYSKETFEEDFFLSFTAHCKIQRKLIAEIELRRKSLRFVSSAHFLSAFQRLTAAPTGALQGK